MINMSPSFISEFARQCNVKKIMLFGSIMVDNNNSNNGFTSDIDCSLKLILKNKLLSSRSENKAKGNDPYAFFF